LTILDSQLLITNQTSPVDSIQYIEEENPNNGLS